MVYSHHQGGKGWAGSGGWVEHKKGTQAAGESVRAGVGQQGLLAVVVSAAAAVPRMHVTVSVMPRHKCVTNHV